MRRGRDTHFFVYREGTPGADALERRLHDRRKLATDLLLAEEVRGLLSRVREGGRGAVLSLVESSDRVRLGPEELVQPATLRAPSSSQISEELRRSLSLAVARTAAFAKVQVSRGFVIRDRAGVFEERVAPIESVGFSMPTTSGRLNLAFVLAIVVAKVAGVPRVVAAVSPSHYLGCPEIRWAIGEAGADEVLLSPDVPGIASLAYGLEGFDPVAKILGPGGARGAQAMRFLAGEVGLQAVSSGSETIVLADGSADVEKVVDHLMAAAELDRDAAAVLLTPADEIVRPVAKAVEARLAEAGKESTACRAMSVWGGALVVESLDVASRWIERFSPERLVVETRDAASRCRTIRGAGIVFVGGPTGSVFGGAVVGLGTMISRDPGGRAASAFSAADFLRRNQLVELSADGAASFEAAGVGLVEAMGRPRPPKPDEPR